MCDNQSPSSDVRTHSPLQVGQRRTSSLHSSLQVLSPVPVPTASSPDQARTAVTCEKQEMWSEHEETSIYFIYSRSCENKTKKTRTTNRGSSWSIGKITTVARVFFPPLP